MPLVPHVAAGQIVASTWGNLVADHVVMRFTTAAQRASQLTAPIVGQLTSRDDAPGVVEYWTGTAWAPTVSPRELAYAQFTALKNINSGSEPAPDTVVQTPSVTYDGATPVIVEVFSPVVAPAAVANATLDILLFEGGVSLGRLGTVRTPAAASLYTPFYAMRRLTPAAGARVYVFAAIQSGGPGFVSAGVGGSGAYMPGFIRVTRAT